MTARDIYVRTARTYWRRGGYLLLLGSAVFIPLGLIDALADGIQQVRIEDLGRERDGSGDLRDPGRHRPPGCHQPDRRDLLQRRGRARARARRGVAAAAISDDREAPQLRPADRRRPHRRGRDRDRPARPRCPGTRLPDLVRARRTESSSSKGPAFGRRSGGAGNWSAGTSGRCSWSCFRSPSAARSSPPRRWAGSTRSSTVTSSATGPGEAVTGILLSPIYAVAVVLMTLQLSADRQT